MSEPDTCSYDRRVNPSIVIVAPGHADTLTDEFGRYARDYDVRTTTSVTQAEDVARSIVDAFTRWPPPSPRPRSRRCGSSPRATMR